MRIALLSTIERSEGGEPRAFLSLGGRKLIDWQLDLVRDLGCEKVICLADGPSAQLDSFRQRVEEIGLDFHAIGGPIQLAGMVSADQELVVLADGVVIDREFIDQNSVDQRGVLVIPAEQGIPAGFERVDAQYAWAGLLIARGQIAEPLAEMPADSNTISLLLRLALQSGAGLMKFGVDCLDDGSILLATSEQVMQQREIALLDRNTQPKSWFGPGIALGQVLARQLASKWTNQGPFFAILTTALVILISLVCVFYRQSQVALAILILASISASTASALSQLKAKLIGQGSSKYLSLNLNILVDISLIISLVYPFDGLWDQRLFAAVLLVASWRLSSLLASEGMAPFWRDRSVLLAILLVLMFWLDAALIIQLLTLIAMASCLFLAGRKRITQA